MSFGHSGSLRFEVNKNSAAPGIFWQREKPKVDQRKFGYKSKHLRHPIRRPDDSDVIEEVKMAEEEEKKKYNKDNVDFIQKNRHRYKPKYENKGQSDGSTHIGPGTVTLTQDQLAALLVSLGGLKNGSNKEKNPLKISIDANSNKIEVEKYESDSDVEINGHDKDDEESNRSVGVGIYDLLNDGDIEKKPKKSKKKPRDTDLRLSREEDRSDLDNNANHKYEKYQNDPGPDTGRSTLDFTKKEAKVDHISPLVPWKHLTVGEKKRMQWAMEKAELPEEYNPWGRPGAGAPAGKQESSPPTTKDGGAHNQKDNDPEDRQQKMLQQRKQEVLQQEIEKLEEEIREAEQRKKMRERKQQKREEDGEKDRKKQRSDQESRERKSVEEKKNENENARNKKRTNRDASESRKKAPSGEEERNNGEQHFGSDQEDLSHLPKKEIERRKWLAELDKQREEQRMKKQQEKERDRADAQDQWADRFVYHKSPQQATPRYEKSGPSPRNQVSVLGKVVDDAPVANAPPAAMRSAMVVGAGTLNENRFDNKKAEEKRQWLEELEKQREEQRRLKAEKKERERRDDDGMWADRYQTDRQKLTQFSDASTHGPPMSEPPQAAEMPRFSSAPEQPATVRDSAEEPATFLRGQGVYVDPVTRKEQEEKRRVHMEYQAEIKAQIEAKERLKREERDRKIREDMEEERKFKIEKERVTRMEENESKKTQEREAIRQKQMAVLKSAMDEAQGKALEEKNVRRMQQLKQGGHDVSQLKAAYEEPVSRMSGHGTQQLPVKGGQSQATTPRIRDYEISNIPGLGNAPSPPVPQASHYNSHAPEHPSTTALENQAMAGHQHQTRPRHPVGKSYTKDPYVEDRVLTPSRLRNPSKPRDEPNSPRREFGTQTLELKDLQSILNSLPDDIQIEYKMRVEEALKEKERSSKQAPSRKVHSKSAEDSRTRKTAPKKEIPREKPVGKERPPRPNERLAWNQTKRKTAIKNSERDPFYLQRKEEADARKIKRERQLQYLQELNKEKIPSHSPTRARGKSPDEGRRNAERARKPVDPSRGRKGERNESPNVLSLLNGDKTNRTRSKSPLMGRRASPPVPTVKHRTVPQEVDVNNPYSYTNSVLRTSQGDTRYGDASVATAPVHDGDFVPFLRTTEILDPAQADEPLAISRENSRMERARKAYHETRDPADKGRKLNVYQDREREAALKASQNPILNPQLVTDHPTARQDMILQQLSSLRQNLMAKRQELENYMSPSELELDQGGSLQT